MIVTIATRKSPLALWQTETVAGLLRAAHPGLEVRLEPVRTAGDRFREKSFSAIGRTGVFTAELDERVRRGEASIAVHSLKDQTTTLPEGILLGAVLPRGPVEDVLVAPRHGGIRDLPKGARIGTGSLRRQAQIKSQRRDFEVVPIRGNVDTRIRKAEEGEVEAVVMARAGLQRLGLEAKITEILEPPRFLPAVGQGAIVITVRAGDQETRRLLLALSDEGTFRAVACERAFLAGIGGGCNVPAGAYAVVEGERLKLSAAVFDPEGTVEIRRERAGSSEDPAALGASLAREILEAGGRALIERARSDVAKGTPDAGGD